MAEIDVSKLLGKLAHTLGHPERIIDAVSKNLSEEAINLIKQGFDDERDPYGTPWEPKKRPDGRKTLSGPTGRLKTGWHIDPTQDVRVVPSVDYAAYHQDPQEGDDGQLKRPRRMMVPSTELGLPAAWAEAFEEVAVETIAIVLRRG